MDRDLADFQRPDGSIATIGDLFEANRPGGPGGEIMPINKYLWRASLDTLQFLPLASTDPFTGVIVTDWSTPPESENERFKVTVFLESPELQARSLRVAVFREVRAQDGGWNSAEVSEATPRRLEDAILTKARQLRVAELQAEKEG
ncbi:MAG: DUF3576 domain-containing protein [Pseudomonadota bacterium]